MQKFGFLSKNVSKWQNQVQKKKKRKKKKKTECKGDLKLVSTKNTFKIDDRIVKILVGAERDFQNCGGGAGGCTSNIKNIG